MAKEDVAQTKFIRPEIQVNLAQQYPLYDGGDARVEKPGHKGPPIHGMLLGIIDLPSVLENSDGERMEWQAFVIELIQPAPACAPGDESVTKMYGKGERIALTITTAMQRFKALAQHPTKVYEVLVEPEVGRTKNKQSLWLYPTVGVVRDHKREAGHRFSATDFLAQALGTSANGLPAGSSIKQGAAGMPSDERFA
jgi:hypothetical protein